MAWRNTLVLLLAASAAAAVSAMPDEAAIQSSLQSFLQWEDASFAPRSLLQVKCPAPAAIIKSFSANKARSLAILKALKAPGGYNTKNCVQWFCHTVRLYKQAGIVKTPVKIFAIQTSYNTCKSGLTAAATTVLGRDAAKTIVSLVNLCTAPASRDLTGLTCGGQVTLF